MRLRAFSAAFAAASCAAGSATGLAVEFSADDEVCFWYTRLRFRFGSAFDVVTSARLARRTKNRKFRLIPMNLPTLRVAYLSEFLRIGSLILENRNYRNQGKDADGGTRTHTPD